MLRQSNLPVSKPISILLHVWGKGKYMSLTTSLRFSTPSCIVPHSISIIESLLYPGGERSKLGFAGEDVRLMLMFTLLLLVYYPQETPPLLAKRLI